MGLFDLFRKQKQVIGKPNETLSQPDILPELPPIPQEARFKPEIRKLSTLSSQNENAIRLTNSLLRLI